MDIVVTLISFNFHKRIQKRCLWFFICIFNILRILYNIGNIRNLESKMRASATELNKHPGKYLNQSLREPVIIERSGHPVSVIVSYERYLQLEDAYWGELATIADQDKSLGVEKTMDFLT